jgi:hypothetical protein
MLFAWLVLMFGNLTEFGTQGKAPVKTCDFSAA